MYSQIQKRAHKAVENAIIRGLLQRPGVCDECSNPCKPHAHHDDYSKPLEVRWLCQSCHAKIHPGEQRTFASRIRADVSAGLVC